MLSELGNYLKEVRLEKNYSLDDLQQLTKIQKRYLVGIEEGNYAVMPGNFYVRAFIKQYAEAVGLDPEQVFEQFRHEIPNTYHDDLPEQLSRVKTHKQMSKSTSKALELLPRILAISAILIVAVIVWVLVQNFMDTKGEEQTTGEEPKEVEIEKGTNPSPIEEAPVKGEENEKTDELVETKEEPVEKQSLKVIEVNGDTTSYELTNTEQFNLKIASKGKTWLEVKNAKGKKFYYNMLQANQEQTFDLTAESEIHLVIGATNNATIIINDEEVPYEVSPKEKVSQRFKIVYKKSE